MHDLYNVLKTCNNFQRDNKIRVFPILKGKCYFACNVIYMDNFCVE